MQKNRPRDKIQTEAVLRLKDIRAIEDELNRGAAVEIRRLRDGTVRVFSVRKKEIELPTVR